MLLNLWDNAALTQSFMDLYNLTGMQMCNILRRIHFDNELDYVKIFCEETGIKLDEVDVAHDIEFLGKIVSTTVDDFEYLRQVGLVPLDILLENDSPISRHLKKFDIEVRPSSHEFLYKENQLYIPYHEDCMWCVYGDEQCRYSKERYKDICCTYLKTISQLAAKLYHDNCEIEMFLSASEDSMLNYSKVKDYPEIFCTVEEFLREQFKEKLSIGREWTKIKQQSFIITVPVKYDEISYLGNFIGGADADADVYFWEYGKFCNEPYDFSEAMPQCFWNNIWLITICLDLICSLEARSTIFAGIKHDTVIPFDRLKIDLIGNLEQ